MESSGDSEITENKEYLETFRFKLNRNVSSELMTLRKVRGRRVRVRPHVFLSVSTSGGQAGWRAPRSAD